MKLIWMLAIAALLLAAPSAFALHKGVPHLDTWKEPDPPKQPPPKPPEDPNKGGAGVGTPTVHGCDKTGCGNNGPITPKQPEPKCKVEQGITVCH